jgi:hypothetical protein
LPSPVPILETVLLIDNAKLIGKPVSFILVRVHSSIGNNHKTIHTSDIIKFIDTRFSVIGDFLNYQ